MEEFEIVFDPLPPDALSRFATESLAAYNVAVTGESSWYPVSFFLKSSGGEWLGALLGEIWVAGCTSEFSEWARPRGAGAMALDYSGPRKTMPPNVAASPRHWKHTATRRGRSTRSAARRFSAPWKITRPVTRNSLCASGWRRLRLRIRGFDYTVAGARRRSAAALKMRASSGWRPSSWRKSTISRLRSVHGFVATIVALRGSPVSNASSPKKSPGP